MLRGMATVSFFADDLPAAQRWYTELLGTEPYFIRPHPPAAPGYVEFRLGDHQHELGIIDRTYAPGTPADRPGGAVVFWHVDDLPATLERLQAMGAREYESLIEREAGFRTASVVDPFGNILGVMYNPHYLEMLNGQFGAG
ncbi:MAG TPA: VOC family protein [Jiangellaceae bacterium]|nr:VOC family protein [Jiangellaceae bacterium]